MANNIDAAVVSLTEAVDRAKTVTDGAVAYIEGIPALIQAAIDETIAMGATPEQVAAFDDLKARLEAEISDLETALTNNTPTPPIMP